MDVPRLLALRSYWSTNPPVHIMIAAYLGLGKNSTSKTDISELASALGAVHDQRGADRWQNQSQSD